MTRKKMSRIATLHGLICIEIIKARFCIELIEFPMLQSRRDAGWSSLAARRAHNPKVAGSNPAPATNY